MSERKARLPSNWDQVEPLTPVEIEKALTGLFNAVAHFQLELMQLRNAEHDARMAYERAHIIATTDPMCPKVERGGITVAERDDWIRGVEFAEYEAYEQAKKRTKNAREYLDALGQQCSLVQSLNRSVTASYLGTPS